MYIEHYGLRVDPFRQSADPYNLFLHSTFHKAQSYLQYGLSVTDGIVLITGDTGTGKSTLINNLTNTKVDGDVDTLVLECGNFNDKELIVNYANSINSISDDSDRSESKNIIINSLLTVQAQGRKSLLILDDAHRLSNDALHKLVELSNLQNNGTPLLQIFLTGLPALQDRLLQQENEQLHQRLVATCNLEALSEKETFNYIDTRTRTSGWEGNSLISTHVSRIIHNACLGLPRWINLTSSRLLLHGMTKEQTHLEIQDVCEVIRDLLNEGLLPELVRRRHTKSGIQVAA